MCKCTPGIKTPLLWKTWLRMAETKWFSCSDFRRMDGHLYYGTFLPGVPVGR